MYKIAVADFCLVLMNKIIVTNLVYTLLGEQGMCSQRSQGRTIGAKIEV